MKKLTLPAALTIAGSNGGIGDEGKIVTEHSTTHNGSDAKCCRKTGCSGHFSRDGRNESNGADGGTHRQRHKTADNKQNSNCISSRNQGEGKISHALGTAAADNADENTRLHKNQDHRDDVLITDSLSHQA